VHGRSQQRLVRRLVLTRARGITLVGLVSVAMAGCIEPVPTARGAAAIAPAWAPPAGAALETACTPTGVELCFNGRDDNCNGAIDEGCGVHTGILQFTAAWDAPTADVDLDVTDPMGELAQRASEPTAGGLRKDRDCPRDCRGQNSENVFLAETTTPAPGKYRVALRLDKLNGATAPIRVQFAARVGPRAFSATVELSPGPGTEERVFELALGGVGSPP